MQFSRSSGDRHRAVTSLGPVRWLGLPFALAALMPLAGAVGWAEVQMEGGGPASPVFLVLFAAPFLAIGLGLMAWRKECVIDLEEGTVTRAARVFWPLATQKRKLDGFVAATFERRVVRGSKSSRTVFPVALETPGGGAFELFHCRDKRAARRAAEWLARTAHLSVIDRLDGAERVRSFEDLDTSLRARRRRDGGSYDPGPPPSKMRSALQVREGVVTFETPAHGFRPLIVLGLAAATGPLWLTVLFRHFAIGDEPLEAVFTVALYAMGGLPAAAMAGTILYHALRRHTVQLTNDALTVQEHGLLRRTVTLAADEIEEVQTAPRDGAPVRFDALLGGGPPVTVVSDQRDVAFGHTLPRKETDYLADVLRCALSA